MQSDLTFLSSEIAKIIESGIEKQLRQSIKYSPFRLFYSLFKKKNPQTIQRIRNMLANDIQATLSDIEKFNVGIFAKNNSINNTGRVLIKNSYNVGIRLVKKLNVKMAFRALRDESLQQKIYNYILKQVKAKTLNILDDF